MKTNQDIHRIVTLHTTFNRLRSRHIDALIDCADHVAFESGQPILRRGETANAFYLISEGEVMLLSHEEGYHDTPVQILSSNDVLGWSWIYPPYEWHFDAYAIDTVRAIRFDAYVVRTLIKGDRELGYQLMYGFGRIMLDRLQNTRTQLLQTLTANA